VTLQGSADQDPWSARIGKLVIIHRDQGPQISGELVAAYRYEIEITDGEGGRIIIPKSAIADVYICTPKSAAAAQGPAL